MLLDDVDTPQPRHKPGRALQVHHRFFPDSVTVAQQLTRGGIPKVLLHPPTRITVANSSLSEQQAVVPRSREPSPTPKEQIPTPKAGFSGYREALKVRGVYSRTETFHRGSCRREIHLLRSDSRKARMRVSEFLRHKRTRAEK